MLNRRVCRQFAMRLGWLVAPPQSAKSQDVRPDLGTLAQLRRGLGKAFGECQSRDGWVLSTLQKASAEEATAVEFSDTDVEWACCVASLFALHKKSSEVRIAAALRQLWTLEGESPPIARRFAVIAEADPRDLSKHLRHTVRLLKSREISFDWGALLFDLVRWTDSERRIQRRWAREFWIERKPTQTVKHT